MPKYQMHAPILGSIYLGEVEADSEAEAIEKAKALPSYRRPALCANCGHKIPDLSAPGEPFVDAPDIRLNPDQKGSTE